jgi:hypothetical protein
MCIAPRDAEEQMADRGCVGSLDRRYKPAPDEHTHRPVQNSGRHCKNEATNTTNAAMANSNSWKVRPDMLANSDGAWAIKQRCGSEIRHPK